MWAGWLVLWGLCELAVAGDLDDVQRLFLLGTLDEARAAALEALPRATGSDALALHLALARIEDRVALHRHTRPSTEARGWIEAAEALGAARTPAGRGHMALAWAEWQYRAELAEGERVFRDARTKAIEAKRLFRRLDDAPGRADAVHRLGLLHLQRGELSRALRRFRASERQERKSQPRRAFLGDLYRHVAFVYLRRGKLDRAVPWFEASLRERRGAGAVDASLFAANSLASALLDLGRIEEGASALDEALALAEHLDSPLGRARNGLLVGRLLRARGDLEGARRASTLR